MKYVIADQYLEALQKKVAKIQRKCASLGLPFSFEVQEPSCIEWVDAAKDTRRALAHYVEVSGVAKINGWQLIGKIEHTDNGNLLLSSPNEAIPEIYRDAKPYCEHCGTRRFRKETFVIRDENGVYKQVGRSCLRLYTDGMDAEACAAYLHMIGMLAECGGSHGDGWLPCSLLTHMVAACYHHISMVGYDREKLCVLVNDSLCHAKIKGNLSGGECYEKYKGQTDAIIAEARALGNVSDYLGNVKVVFSDNVVDDRRLMLVASYVYGYMKQALKAEATAKKAAASAWIGNVGERVSFRVKVTENGAYRVLYTKSHYVNYYVSTTSYVVEFIDVDGNVLKWDASNLSEIDEAVANGAETLTIKATVKRHDEYKGVKQTVITRARLA